MKTPVDLERRAVVKGLASLTAASALWPRELLAGEELRRGPTALVVVLVVSVHAQLSACLPRSLRIVGPAARMASRWWRARTVPFSASTSAR